MPLNYTHFDMWISMPICGLICGANLAHNSSGARSVRGEGGGEG